MVVPIQDHKENSEENEGEEEEEGEEEGEGEESTGGFGGIKVSSVDEIIAKARAAEAFLNVPNAGLLGSSLTELAGLVEGEKERENNETEELQTTTGKEK